jgi:glycosyltransferase involved in cell wall biosynthesis
VLEPATSLVTSSLNPSSSSAAPHIDVSVVMPCLNEERSVGVCVAKAWEGIRRTGMSGEVIVVDNGSDDGSVAAAEAAGARVIHEARRGYGSAYMAGFQAALGRYIVMGDSDNSYDFASLADLVSPLEQGYDYVLGSRFAGRIEPEAMTWSHRYVGNPILTFTLNMLFNLRVSDAHSGFRAFTRDALQRLHLQSEGMELASEIVVKAARGGLRVAEVPITYYRRIGESKLNAFKDAWRHVRFLLLLSPEYLFVVPGIAFLLAGLGGQLALFASGPSALGLMTKILMALLTLAGSQLLIFGLFAKTHVKTIGLDNKSRISDWVEKTFTLEHGLVAAGMFAGVGVLLVVRQFVVGWAAVPDGGTAASLAILGLLSTVLGAILSFDAFFLAMLGLRLPSPAGTPSSSTERATVSAES